MFPLNVVASNIPQNITGTNPTFFSFGMQKEESRKGLFENFFLSKKPQVIFFGGCYFWIKPKRKQKTSQLSCCFWWQHYNGSAKVLIFKKKFLLLVFNQTFLLWTLNQTFWYYISLDKALHLQTFFACGAYSRGGYFVLFSTNMNRPYLMGGIKRHMV